MVCCFPLPTTLPAGPQADDGAPRRTLNCAHIFYDISCVDPCPLLSWPPPRLTQGRNKGKGHNKRYAGKKGKGEGGGGAGTGAPAPALDASGNVIPGAGYVSLAGMESPLFEEYYKRQGIVPEGEWATMLETLHRVLPVTFRINAKDPMGPAYVQC